MLRVEKRLSHKDDNRSIEALLYNCKGRITQRNEIVYPHLKGFVVLKLEGHVYVRPKKLYHYSSFR